MTAGPSRKFHVLAFAAESAAECVNMNGGSLLPAPRLSGPLLIASQTFDILPGDNVVNIKASFNGAVAVENCEWTSPPALHGGSLAINGGATYTNTGLVTISNTIPFTATEAYYTTDSTCGTGGSWEPYSSSRPGFALPAGDGIKNIYAKFRDSSNATSSCLAAFITLDQTPPTLTLPVFTPVNIANHTSYSFNGTCSENGQNINWTIGALSGTASCMGSTFTVGALNFAAQPDGMLSGNFSLTDLAGNTASQPDVMLKDTIAPTVAFTSPAPSTQIPLAQISNVNVQGTCSENGRTINLVVGGVSALPTCVSGNFSAILDLSTVPEGAFVINATTTDVASNVGGATLPLIKDTIAPIALLSGTPTTILDENATATINVAGVDVVAYRSLVTQNLSACASLGSYSAEVPVATPINVTRTAEAGIYHVCVIGRDLAGNYQATGAHSATAVTFGPIVIGFQNPTSVDTEAVGFRMIPVVLSTASSVPISVEIQTQGTAQAGLHYTGFNQDVATLNIPAGTLTANFPVSVIGATITTNEKHMSLGIRGSSTTAGLELGISEHQLWIQDSGATPSNFLKISMGASHTCAIDSLGRIFCWGNNGSGQLGIGTFVNSPTPTLVDPGNAYVEVATGVNSTCAVRASGQLYCWGNNSNGQLGDGTTTARSVPTMVSGATSVAKISIGNGFACYVGTSGDLWCWGNQADGRLGNNTGSGSALTPISIAGTGISNVSAGWDHACSVSTAGLIQCWGLNTNGALGTGDNVSSPTPRIVGPNYNKVSVGAYATCAIKTDGSLHCWGLNSSGAVGDGSPTNRNVPTAILVGSTVVQVSAGADSACAVTDANNLYCWGANSKGQLGDGTTDMSINPKLISTPGDWLSVSVGASVMCAIDLSSSLWCAGRNESGELARGSTTPLYHANLQNVGSNFTSVQVGKNVKTNAPGASVCGIQSGVASCWGASTLGQNAPATSPVTTITAFDITETYTEIHVGELQQCARTTGNLYRCRGFREEAQLPLGMSNLQPNIVTRVRF